MSFERLLSPGKIGKMELKNRFVVPPMGTNYGTYEGFVTDEMIEYYRRRAAGGFGLIIVEVTAVDPKGKAIVNEVGLWDDEHIYGFRKLVDAVHKEGAKVIIQLHHCGRQTAPAQIFNQNPEAPSRVACPVMNVVPDEMSVDRIWQVINQFGDAAVRAKQAGADGIEVHGAHGYLIAQFMSPHANKRVDEFGGDFEGRMKFPREIFRNIRSKVGYDYPMTFRFGYDEKVTGGRTLEESVMVARMAEEESVNALHVSIMTYGSMQYMSASQAMPNGFNQFPTKAIKEAVNIPVISVGRYTPWMAESALLNGCADFISFGRASLAEPNLPNLVKEGRTNEICPCISCTQSCINYIFVGDKCSCLVNPVTGHETEYDLSEVEYKKNVAIVGAGPAGLYAAMIAAKKGHRVTVYEKTNYIGGQFRLGAIPPAKQEITTAIKYYHTMGVKYGVNYRMNYEPSADELKGYEVVILATGSTPAKPQIPGIENANVIDALDVLSGDKVPGGNVLVLGGGMTGVETAEFMAEHNRAVTVLEMRPDIALDEGMIPRAFLMPRLAAKGVQKIVNAKVETINQDGVTYVSDGEEKTVKGFDTIVLALGVKSNNPLEEQLKDQVKELYVIGDAKQVGSANKATESALAVAARI